MDRGGKNTGVGCHFLLQGMFPTQGSNPCLPASPALQVASFPLSHLRSPTMWYYRMYLRKKNLHTSGLVQFKLMLFRGQLYMCVCVCVCIHYIYQYTIGSVSLENPNTLSNNSNTKLSVVRNIKKQMS